jgi:hypothetical protein
MMGRFRRGCAWIGTPLAQRASGLLGRCGRVIHSPSALKTAPCRAVSALSPPSPSLRQRRVLLNKKERNVWKTLVARRSKPLPASSVVARTSLADYVWKLQPTQPEPGGQHSHASILPAVVSSRVKRRRTAEPPAAARPNRRRVQTTKLCCHPYRASSTVLARTPRTHLLSRPEAGQAAHQLAVAVDAACPRLGTPCAVVDRIRTLAAVGHCRARGDQAAARGAAALA